jgi:hypothetical protein
LQYFLGGTGGFLDEVEDRSEGKRGRLQRFCAGSSGLLVQRATEDEALENIRDAIQEYRAARDDLLKGAVVREVEVTS